MTKIGAIWAATPSGVIGDGKDLLWRLPEDLKYFSAITSGTTVIMGRKTWDSLPEKFRPLPNRVNFIISRTETSIEGATVFSSIEEALQAVETDEAWFIGGGQIYTAALDFVKEIKVTVVNLEVTGETVAPNIDNKFILSDSSEWKTSSKDIEYKFETWVLRDSLQNKS